MLDAADAYNIPVILTYFHGLCKPPINIYLPSGNMSFCLDEYMK